MRILDTLSPNKVLDKRSREYIIGVWILIVALFWISSPSIFVPKPTEVWNATKDLWLFQDLGTSLITSLMLNIESICIAAVISLGLAYLYTIPIFKPPIAFIGKLRFLSLVGLSFFFTLMTSSGHALRVSVLVFAVTVFFVVGMLDVIAAIPNEQYDLARTLKMNNWETLWQVVILGQGDQAFVILRQNAAMSWMFISVVEGMSRSGGGIGGLLLNSNKHFHLAEVFAIQIIILILGLAQDYIIGLLRNICCPYVNLRTR